MAALPYMQLYVADYLADTAHLSATEHGAYLLLMFNYWQRGESFSAKDQQMLNKRLASVARMSSEEWSDVRGSLEEFFEVTDTEWKHHRIERDLVAVKAKSTIRKDAGKASAQRRANKCSTDAEQMPNKCSTDAEQMPNYTDTDTDTEKKRSVVDDSPTFLEAKKVADHLAKKIADQNPGAKVEPSGWIADIEKAIRLDGRSTADLLEIIDWMYTGDLFWVSNVMSGKKLRQKFEQMAMQKWSKPATKHSPQVHHLPARKQI